MFLEVVAITKIIFCFCFSGADFCTKSIQTAVDIPCRISRHFAELASRKWAKQENCQQGQNYSEQDRRT